MSRDLARIQPAALGALGVCLFIVAPWLAASHLGVRSVILPHMDVMFFTAVDLIKSNQLLPAAYVSFLRVNAGFLLALSTAIPLGMLLARFPRLYLAAEPVIESFRFIIPFAWIPLAVLWFGTSEAGKIFIIWYAGFFVILLPTITAVRSIDPDLVKVARTLGASRLQVFLKVDFPSIIPELVTAARIAFGMCWITILAAEMVASRNGLGYLISDARELLQTDVVLVGMFVIGAIGATYNWFFGALGRLVDR